MGGNREVARPPLHVPEPVDVLECVCAAACLCFLSLDIDCANRLTHEKKPTLQWDKQPARGVCVFLIVSTMQTDWLTNEHTSVLLVRDTCACVFVASIDRVTRLTVSVRAA